MGWHLVTVSLPSTGFDSFLHKGPIMPWRIVRCIVLLVTGMSWEAVAMNEAFPQNTSANSSKDVLRIGVIGLDTSHAPAFAKLWNSNKAEGLYAKQEIVAAFPGGSPDIESSINRVPGYTKEFRELGVEIVDSVDRLLEKVDAVIIHSLDGRKHLEQAIPVLRAKKRLFIDKPLAASLADAVLIDKVAKKYQTPWFSSSSLRFSAGFWKYRSDEALRKDVLGALAWSPCSLESTHPDLFWYGVHGVETLYTAMGTGCVRVSRTNTPGTDVVIGVWNDGRIGQYRGHRDSAKSDAYGLIVFGPKKVEVDNKFDGYAPLVARVAAFFDGEPAPVSAEETIEMFAFMEAADESKRRQGAPVTIAEVLDKATQEANKRLSTLTGN
jgi:hypothetical protein